MEKLLQLLACTALLTCADTLAAADTPKPTAKPNLVFLLLDDLGYADCGFMGGKDIRTPHIDKLARAGTVLESLYVQPVCLPTRAALMTGRYATRTGVYTIVRPHATWGLPLTERTLATALREAGYETALTGKWHLGEFQPAYLPTARGFDHQYGHYFGMIDYFTHIRGGTHDWYRNDKEVREEGYSTHLIAREACKLIAEKDKTKPLFLYVPFNGVHAPLQVPENYLTPYATLRGPRQKLAGMLAAVDEAIGQIVAARGAVHRPAPPQMIALRVAGIEAGLHVAQTFAPGELGKDQADELAPARELADLVIPVKTGDAPVELLRMNPVEELGEDVFSGVHARSIASGGTGELEIAHTPRPAPEPRGHASKRTSSSSVTGHLWISTRFQPGV